MSRGRRLSVRDRSFLTTDMAKVIGPLAGVTAADLRRAVRQLYAERPATKALLRLDRDAGRWRPVAAADLPAWADGLVIDLGPADDAEAVVARLMAEPLRDRPLVFGAGGAYAGIRLNHATGDARVASPLFAEVMQAAASGRTARNPLPTVRLPLLRAVAHHFGRHPGRIPAALKVRRTPELLEPHAGQVPWTPAPAHHWARSAPGATAQLRRWRDEHAAGVSIAAVLFAAASAAFARCVDAAPRPGVVVLVDARRYLPPGTPVDGNFASGQYVQPHDVTDPRAVHDAMTEQLSFGRSLTMLALHNVRLGLLPRRATVPRTAAAHPRPQLSLTYLGRTDAYADLPWVAPDTERRMIDVVGTTGPEGVTVAIEEIGGTLHATTTYHANVFDAGDVAAATEALIRDPAALLADSTR